jgi:hypothetical protein
MILRSILGILVTLLAMLAGFYVAVWRVKKRLRPGALLVDEGLRTLRGGLFKATIAKGHLGGRPVSLRVYLGRWSRTLIIGMACDSTLDFTIWMPGRKGTPKMLSVDGYSLLAASEFHQEPASISRDSSRFLAWARQPVPKDTLNALATTRDNWRLELQSSVLQWTDFNCRDDEFTSHVFGQHFALLTHLASSLEAVTDDVSGSSSGHPLSYQ